MDILVWGKDETEHGLGLTVVVEKLRNTSITLNEKKCEFSVKKIKFLGNILDDKNIHPHKENIATINEYPPPTNKSELEQLL